MASIGVSVKNHFFDDYAQRVQDSLTQTIKDGCLLIESEAKEKCPVDTGNLRASIHSSYDEDEMAGFVGTPVEYAGYVEFGTIHQSAQPYLMPAYEENIDKIINKMKKDIRGN